MEENKDYEAQGTAQEPVDNQEPNEPAANNQVLEISTKDALRALGRNAKVKAKQTWERAKPKLKVIATVGAIAAAGAYAYSELTKPELGSDDLKSLEPPKDDIPDAEYMVMDQTMNQITQEPVVVPVVTNLGTEDVTE